MKFDNISTTKLAKICGVSQGTVDRALNNRSGISPATKEKILNAAKEYGYRPNIHARSIAGGKSQLIGIVVFDLNNQYFSEIISNIEACCSESGYSAVIMFTNKDSEKEIECIKNLYHMSVDGIILCPINEGEEYENFLLSLNIPIVTIGNRLNKIQYVGIDNTSAMKEATEYVLNKGYKTLIYVKPELKENNTFAQTERLNAFLSICENSNVNTVITNFQNAEKEIIKAQPCAIVCPTDIYAIKLLNIAQKYSCGIVGFDNPKIIDELGLKLDSVSYDVTSAAKLAVSYITNGEIETQPINHSIIKRGSIIKQQKSEITTK